MKKHILQIFLAMLLFTGAARSQVIRPVTTGLPYSRVLCVGADDQFTYTLCAPQFLKPYPIYKWNKDGYGDTLMLYAGASSQFNRIMRHNNHLFVAGRIDTILGMESLGLVYYEGTWKSWLDTADKNASLYTITDLQEVGKDLYGLGTRTVGSDRITAIFLCDSMLWDSIVFPVNQEVTALTSDGTNLFALVTEDDTTHIVKQISFPGNITDITTGLVSAGAGGDLIYYDSQFFVGKGGMLWNGHRWETEVFNDFVERNFSILDETLYAIGTSSDPSKYLLYKWNNRLWETVEQVQDIEPVTFNPIVTGGGRMFIFPSDTIRRPGDNRLFNQFLTTRSQVKGRVYLDRNNSCSFTEGIDTAFDLGVLKAQGVTTTLKNATPSGDYTLFLDSGNHIISMYPPRYYKVTCPSIGTYTRDLYTDSIVTGIDFGLTIDNFTPDIAIKVVPTTGFRTRLGYTGYYYLTISNPGTLPLASQQVHLEIKKDPGTNLKSSHTFTKNGNEITWTSKALNPMERDTIGFSILYDTSMYHMGDTVIFAAFAPFAFADGDTTDNYDSAWQLVTSAYDPNDKQSYPIDKLYAYTKEVKYHIRFQNTGNDTAIRVTVIDTFDVSLPIYEVQQGQTSHPYTVKLENNVISWVFNNINLPDSSTNEEASHGWISFVARVNPDLAFGDSIINRAHIYFDYQEPIRTNKAVNVKVKTDNSTGIPKVEGGLVLNTCKVYPNPAESLLTLENLLAQSQWIKVYDAYGREVYREQLMPQATAQLDVSGWSNGLYILVTGDQQSLKLVVQH